ncbi:hypothetical protein ABC977_17680 [Thioalkalicoccus limnaeus]|uniref:Uncharacterized protein n=2 Tax=Thioalkalicoccus limnaeus TaxID=120681 RepID=A0ABV4BP16_9GAMM
MRRLALVRLWTRVQAQGGDDFRICSGGGGQPINPNAVAHIANLDSVFGNEAGDWEMSFDGIAFTLTFRSGSWEGKTFIRKINWAIAFMRGDGFLTLLNDFGKPGDAGRSS